MNINVLDNFGFGEEFDGEDKFLAYRPKRQKYKVFDGPPRTRATWAGRGADMPDSVREWQLLCALSGGKSGRILRQVQKYRNATEVVGFTVFLAPSPSTAVFDGPLVRLSFFSCFAGSREAVI